MSGVNHAAESDITAALWRQGLKAPRPALPTLPIAQVVSQFQRPAQRETSAMTRHLPTAENANSCARRRLLQTLLYGPFVVSIAAIAGCGKRRDLPPERVTRGKFGQGKP